MTDLKGSQTEANLRQALARESQSSHRYLYFAQQAEIDGHPEIAGLFRSVAETESTHAFGHLDFLTELGDPGTDQPVGTTEDNLRSAIAGETYDYTEMYPTFAATARSEGFDAIADWLDTLVDSERGQERRFARSLDGLTGKAE